MGHVSSSATNTVGRIILFD